MMQSLILQTIARLLLGWMFLFSLWVLFRGHNAPGGGFPGGLIAASSLSLYLLAYGVPRLLTIIKFSPTVWLCAGLILMVSSSLWGLLVHAIFLSHVWLKTWDGLINSVLFFDVGVYLVVSSSVLMMIIALEETS
ncbi:MnhB domain-containing protein [Legionella impletisoli]|uniref:Na(+)/H(+) antiporter subunit B n=1 Tax=Legionella impletisoli TaxID=343510 RepID=A0A917NDK6_9GAMM|nr:MnhB domain-containing protein [Legionella impletisoli]GGI90290.1 Na(+)/H(+) antiporter subunit B [Legionella impletisoli]